MKICKHCNNNFNQTSNRQLYCKLCIPIIERNKINTWRNKNPEKLSKIQKISYIKYKKQRAEKYKEQRTFYQKSLQGKEVKRYYRLRKQYGITKDKYKELIEKQNHLCAICDKKFDYDLFVDHCHTTGKVRGLLCRTCNLGLGYLKDNITLLKKSIIYVKNNS